ncbi:flavohemoglobin expression-modulating QEGLA motif protein [Marinobacterium arenosum]|uniref:flavohemoglobin expression-modulating QEGLA motif protein n=1 Tax=Marinobacterium arenosum TaxID=2862496 RepID=UPI001C980347|nr:flavohemoglobin expression-modulating QEGLA motif protein [Marinobacterium arenosum]MBY4675099.1 flavohemoglobin expression-modulating QEGLA motif protein [Marinobacterium arenosum]
MLTLSETELLARIADAECFEATLDDGSLTLKIEQYVPHICTAVHDGSRLREELVPRCLLSEQERYFEEDPYTGELIGSMPITLVSHDSRYEYDLNRPLSRAVYQRAWGKEVWHKRPTSAQLARSYDKHRRFYRILDALIEQLQNRFGSCLVFDLHSYNHVRIGEGAPTFNIGTEQIDMDRWERVVKRFGQQLAGIRLPNVQVDCAYNKVFWGRGYMIAHVNSRFENTLVLPVEVKKVFMDELSGEPYPLVLNELKDGMKQALVDTASYFAHRYTRTLRSRRQDMLAPLLDPAISQVDRALYKLARDVETLQYINPTNILLEKRRFFSRSHYQPQFSYRQLNIDPYLFREQLYRLPVDRIRDAGIQQLYRKVVDNFAEKIDLLVSIGSDRFIYNSLRYYGEPSEQDVANAQFLLYAPSLDEREPQEYGAAEMVGYFREQAQRWGLDCRVETSNRLVAKAMVNNARRRLLVRKDVKVGRTELQALAHHELGVHMVTTLNAVQQPLKVFSLGLPSNTMSQEGLAILSEYLSGNMTLQRLKMLALRVLAVKQMLRHGDFRKTWQFLVQEHGQSPDSAFQMAIRVHRGGGFTKDYLYLRGLREALQLHQSQDISALFIGKTGFEFLPIIDEMISRGILQRPAFLPEFMRSCAAPNAPVLEYLVNSIRTERPAAGVLAERVA